MEKLNGDKISIIVIEVNYLISQINNEMFIGNINKSQLCIKNILFVGCLRENLGYWCLIGINRYVLDVIENGYKMLLFIIFEFIELKNNRFVLMN